MENMPLMELPPLAEDIHGRTREASQNTSLDMREFLGIGKALYKPYRVNWHMIKNKTHKKDSKKLK